MVRSSLVPQHWMLDGEAVTIRCDTVLYPLASMHLSIGEKTITVKAAVSETLPVAVLLGTDVEELSALMEREVTLDDHIDNVMVVETRASKDRRLEEERLVREREVLTGATPTPLESEGIHTLIPLHTPNQEQVRTAADKQEGPVHILAQEFRQLQEKDSSLGQKPMDVRAEFL